MCSGRFHLRERVGSTPYLLCVKAAPEVRQPMAAKRKLEAAGYGRPAGRETRRIQRTTAGRQGHRAQLTGLGRLHNKPSARISSS